MDAKDKKIAKLKKLLQAALEKIARLEAEIAQLKKNSSNSSKPPSSDIVKPPKPKQDKERRKIGAQKGHKQHLRKPIAPELVDEVIKLELTECPDCGQQLDLAKIEPKTTQQIELVEKPFTVTEYQQLMYWCKKCRCYHYVALPKEVVPCPT